MFHGRYLTSRLILQPKASEEIFRGYGLGDHLLMRVN